eukprot:scaffold1509_cov240-Pinguiococcus_pyrenoidosus.AAC.27
MYRGVQRHVQRGALEQHLASLLLRRRRAEVLQTSPPGVQLQRALLPRRHERPPRHLLHRGLHGPIHAAEVPLIQARRRYRTRGEYAAVFGNSVAVEDAILVLVANEGLADARGGGVRLRVGVGPRTQGAQWHRRFPILIEGLVPDAEDELQ